MNISDCFRSRLPWLSVLLAFCLALPGVAQDEEDETRPVPDFGDDPDAPIDTRYEKAQKLHLEGMFSKAYMIYDEILNERPTDVPTLVTYGNMKWKEGDFQEAEKRLKRAIEIMPEHIKARQFLGQMYLYQGRRREAREQFDAMHQLKFMREDILNSAKLNLGKIEMLSDNFRAARDQFVYIKGNGNKADRNTGERGMIKLKWMLELHNWPRFDSKHLYIHFSPALSEFKERAQREKYAADLDQWISATITRLGLATPEPWHLYVFANDDECTAITGREQAHGWDYSWWFSFTAHNSEFPVKHTLAVQLAARCAGSRPISRSTVEGFSAYLAGDPVDPHAKARALLEDLELPTILDLHAMQRRQWQREAGTSFVRFLIDTHGFEKFMKLWKWMNIITDAPRFRKGRSTSTDWEEAYNALYGECFGVTLLQTETAWRSFLNRAQ